MLLATSATDAMQRSRQVEVNGRHYTLAEYVGAAPKKGIYVDGNEINDNGLPQAFLVIQPPGAVTPAHFHEPNQFQVFVEGDGRIGAHPTAPLTVQYANGHTPYGPDRGFRCRHQVFHASPTMGSRCQVLAGFAREARYRQPAGARQGWAQHKQRHRSFGPQRQMSSRPCSRRRPTDWRVGSIGWVPVTRAFCRSRPMVAANIW